MGTSANDSGRPPLSLRIFLLTGLALLAFAGNSLLCRIALGPVGMDAASFTAIRLVSGAAMLGLMLRVHGAPGIGGGNWPSALALFTYAAAFSFAYLSLTAATGALLLFGAVQASMIGHGLWKGERFGALQWLGLLLALAGLLGLLLPGLSAPPLVGALLMLSAGVAWAVYSLRGRGTGNPTIVTAGNFLRAAPLGLLLVLPFHADISLNAAGIGYAIASGALASGLGYAVWYAVLPSLPATHAATVQLSVPVVVALGGVAFLGEAPSLRLVLAAIAILGGIALVMGSRWSAGK
ncbi:MAG: DMT family transporter [Gammaproteobacteria bacterium]|nr:DMT family transporter [Gammaproteobacteria bacterium]